MVHICNIKMSANTIRHKSSYDIDGFINQLLASEKFDQLAEKVADKAAIRIKNIESSSAHLEPKKINKSKETIPQNYREYDKTKSFDNNLKSRNDNPPGMEGKIDPQAVMNGETTSQADNLRLKYKYLTRNAYEKKVFSDRASETVDHNPINRNDKIEETPKLSDKMVSVDNTKAESHISNYNQELTEKNLYSPQKDFIDDGNHWRHETRDINHKEPDTRGYNQHENIHSDLDGQRNDNIKNNDYPREEQGLRHEQQHYNEGQNSRPEFKSVLGNQTSQEVGHADNSTVEEEGSSSAAEEQQEEPHPAEENTKEEENAHEESGNSGTEDKVESETEEPSKIKTANAIFRAHDEEKVEHHTEDPGHVQFRAHEDENHSQAEDPHRIQFRANEENVPDIEENKVAPDNVHQPETNEHHSQEKAEDPRLFISVEQKYPREPQGNSPPNNQMDNHSEQSNQNQPEFDSQKDHEPDDQRLSDEQGRSSSEELRAYRSDEAAILSTRKPIVRREGEKLYAYLEAPEYAEFHEELAKLQNQNENSARDFIM